MISTKTSIYRTVYVAILGCALAVASMVERNYSETASRLDLKVMTLELKGKSTQKMGILRNDYRRRSVRFQFAVTLLAIAVAMGVASLAIVGGGIWILLGVSLIATASSGYFIALAVM